MNPRILVVKHSADLPPGWTRKAPYPDSGLDTGEYWQVVNVGESVVHQFDVVLVTQRAWGWVQSGGKFGATWWAALVANVIAEGGCAVWLWEDE